MVFSMNKPFTIDYWYVFTSFFIIIVLFIYYAGLIVNKYTARGR